MSEDKQQEEYRSSLMLLEHISKEYDKEDLRASKIESRIPIFITIVTFFGGFIFSFGGKDLTSIYNKGYKIYSLYIIIYIACVVMLLIALGVFIWILCSKKYMRINIELFSAKSINNERVEKSAYELIRGYQEVLKNNIKINDIKIKQYNIGIGLLVGSTILYLLIQILNFIIS